MKILLWTDDLMSRVRIESGWKAAGAQMLRRDGTETPDLVVMDLLARGAREQIRQLRAAHPDLPILAFGPHVDGEAFKEAKAAGASELVARGAVAERVLRHLMKRG
jgi:DNA-binding NarL/FixJ family response regulator